MSHLKKVTIFSFCLLLSLFFACKKEQVNNNDGGFPLQLTAQQDGRNVVLDWTETKVSSFEEYIIVRSTEPIPVDFVPTPFSQFVIERLDEFEDNQFIDNSPLLAERIYYKVFADIGDRFLQSEEVIVEYEVTILNRIPTRIAHNPDTDLLYIYDGALIEILAYNYVTNENGGKVGTNSSQPSFCAGNNGNGEELYVVNTSTSLKVYDAFTLELKETITPASNIFMRQVATNNNGHLYIYTDNFSNNIKVIDVNSESIVGNFSSNINNPRLFMLDEAKNELVVVGNFEIELIDFDNNGNIESESQTNTNSFPTNNGGFGVSSDNQFFMPYVDGSIYDENLNNTNNLSSTNSFFEDFAFSSDGTKIFAADNNFLRVQQFSFPDLQLEETYNFSYFINRIFEDDGSLIVVGTLNDFTGTKTIIETINY